MNKKKRSILNSILIIITMISFQLFSTFFSGIANASTSRIAMIKAIQGEVFIQKAGGEETFQAFVGLTLNQGDHIRTGEKSSAVLEIIDHQDEITISSNADLYISSLNNNAGSKITKFQLWSGSIWAKVKSLLHSLDRFEIETPTAIMGVRGTQFYTSVDLLTGNTKVIVGAGVVRTHMVGLNQMKQESFVFPTEQLNLFKNPVNHNSHAVLSPLDLNGFVQHADASIIKAIIRNKNALDQENQQLIQTEQNLINKDVPNTEANQLEINNSKDIDRLNHNVSNLVNIIAKKAIEEKKLTTEEWNGNTDATLEWTQNQEEQLKEMQQVRDNHMQLIEDEKKAEEKNQPMYIKEHILNILDEIKKRTDAVPENDQINTSNDTVKSNEKKNNAEVGNGKTSGTEKGSSSQDSEGTDKKDNNADD